VLDSTQLYTHLINELPKQQDHDLPAVSAGQTL
jgi:hypothetical protein